MESVKSLLCEDEVYHPGSTIYLNESLTWAAQKNLHPKIVARPSSLESLSKLIALLSTTDLDFAVRCGGVGSSSARDVLVSLSAFKDFAFDSASETITIGAGQTWGEVDDKMFDQVPGYAAISARCTYVGVGGSILTGGISWLSSEYGLASDPQNMIDAQVVKSNGDILWASKEPGLMWALRGGGGGFGVVTQFKLKVYKHTQSILSGMIYYPETSSRQVAKAVGDFAKRNNDPKMAMHLCLLQMVEGGFVGQDSRPGLVIWVYDANGEEHGRSKNGFAWALEIAGAVEQTKIMNLRDVNRQGDSLRAAMGMANSWSSGVTVPAITEQLIIKGWNWFFNLIKTDPKLAAGSYILIEVMQKPAFQSISSSGDCAWPHTANQSILQLGTGALPGSPETDGLALKALAEAPYQICESYSGADHIPNFVDSFHDPNKIYNQNYDKLLELKHQYDPQNRLKGVFGTLQTV